MSNEPRSTNEIKADLDAARARVDIIELRGANFSNVLIADQAVAELSEEMCDRVAYDWAHEGQEGDSSDDKGK